MSVETIMDQFFTRDYTGDPFQLFGAPHLIGLGICFLSFIALFLIGPRFSVRQQVCFRYTLVAILLVNEILWQWWNWTTGQWLIQEMLPLNLCSMLIILSAIMLVTKRPVLFELVYFLGIAGATQVLLTPNAGMYGFPHYRFFQVIVSHWAIVTAGVYVVAVERFWPTLRSVFRVLIILNIYAVITGIVNILLDSNYLFIAEKPDTASLMDILPVWPWYIPVLEVIAVLFVMLLYLPFVPKKSMQRNTTTER